MPRPQKDPLRLLTPDEWARLERIGRSPRAPGALVAGPTAVVAVAAGPGCTAAARAAGRQSGDAVAHLVARFNREGLAAVEPGHGGGQPQRYPQRERERILREARREPDRDRDGTATWSLTTLQRALRRAPDGLPTVSTYTIWSVLHEAGWRWGKDRSWCQTGVAVRKRKSGPVTLTDSDAGAKKT